MLVVLDVQLHAADVCRSAAALSLLLGGAEAFAGPLGPWAPTARVRQRPPLGDLAVACCSPRPSSARWPRAFPRAPRRGRPAARRRRARRGLTLALHARSAMTDSCWASARGPPAPHHRSTERRATRLKKCAASSNRRSRLLRPAACLGVGRRRRRRCLGGWCRLGRGWCSVGGADAALVRRARLHRLEAARARAEVAMLPGGVLLVLLLVAATARGDSSHDFDRFRTFRDGLPAQQVAARGAAPQRAARPARAC